MSKTTVNLGRKSAYTADPTDLTIIGLDTDHKQGEHPLWDERSKAQLDESMVLNIMVYGVIKPVVCVREGDDLLLVDGRQRVLSAREANKRLAAQGSPVVKVPLLMRNGEDHRLLGVMVSANEHRRADDMLVKAAKAQRMLDFEATVEEVANAFGVTPTTIEEWQRLLGASTKVKKAVRAGKLSATAAATLAKLGREEQEAKLADMVARGRTTVAEAEKVVAEAKGKKKPASAAPTNPAPKKALLRRMLTSPETGKHLHPEAEAMLAWVLGEGKASEAHGLPALLKKLGA